MQNLLKKRQKRKTLPIFLCVWVFCLLDCMCTTCVIDGHGDQKTVSEPKNWNYR